MTKKLNNRDWVKKYEPHLQNNDLIKAVNVPELEITHLSSWSFLKLAFLWSYAYYIYAPIAGKFFKNIYYVDLFSGTGLCSYDYDGNEHLLLGSPILMSTLQTHNPFKKCYFFEKFEYISLEERMQILRDEKLLSCGEYEIFPEDCNSRVDDLIKELKTIPNAHFLLFVDPYSTEIDWSTLEKFLNLEYPKFDMIFNFLPFGVNRQSNHDDKMCKFFGDEDYKKCLVKHSTERLQSLEDHYIENLKKYPNNVKVIHKIRIKSGKSFYYDLLYTTRKDNPSWIKGVEHLGKTIEKLSGYEVSVILDPCASTLDEYFR